MKEYREIINDVLCKMEEYYAEYGKRDMTYTYGYLDAVAVVRDMLDSPQSSRKLKE